MLQLEQAWEVPEFEAYETMCVDCLWGGWGALIMNWLRRLEHLCHENVAHLSGNAPDKTREPGLDWAANYVPTDL